MAFPQYRIPVERLKEEWEFRKRMERLRRKHSSGTPSKIIDNSEPWIRNPSSVAELWEIACKVNETVRERHRAELPTASLDEAKSMLGRYVDCEVCAAALENPSEDVRKLAIAHLRVMAAEGDRFARTLLEKRETL